MTNRRPIGPQPAEGDMTRRNPAVRLGDEHTAEVAGIRLEVGRCPRGSGPQLTITDGANTVRMPASALRDLRAALEALER